MDWSIGNSLQDLLVPQDQERFQNFQSPENWSRWEISASECHNSPPHKFFGMDGYITQTQSFRGLSDNSFSQETQRSDFQLHNFNGIEQMDDIFLDSFLEDVPGNREIQESFCSVSSANGNNHNHMECSSYFQTQDELCDPSLRFDNGEVSISPFIPSTSVKLDSIPLNGSFEENSSGVVFPEEQSVEESVLQEFQGVMKKLTEKSRICFRDTFYRLAKTSEHKSLSQCSNSNPSAKTPKWAVKDTKPRSGRKKTVESETNAIDRAVANLTFNRMDSNVHDFPLAGSINSEESFIQMVESPDRQSYYEQIQHFPTTPGGVADGFVWRNPDVESRQA